MNCRSTQKQLPAYLDGGLPAPQNSALQAHLRVCDDCRAHSHALAGTQKSVRAALDSYPRIKATPGFDLRVLNAVSQRQSRADAVLDWFDTFFARPLPKLLGSSVVGITFGALLVAALLPRATLVSHPMSHPASAPTPASIVAVTPSAAPRLYAWDNLRSMSRVELMRELDWTDERLPQALPSKPKASPTASPAKEPPWDVAISASPFSSPPGSLC